MPDNPLIDITAHELDSSGPAAKTEDKGCSDEASLC